MMLSTGETVLAEEHFFMINAYTKDFDRSGWCSNQKDVIRDHHWWTIEALINPTETIFPRDLIINILKTNSSGPSTLTAS